MCVWSPCCRVVSSLGLILQVHVRYSACSWCNLIYLLPCFRKGLLNSDFVLIKLRYLSGILMCIIQINHQPDATIFQFIILTFIYSSTCFGRSPAYYQELNDFSSSLWFYLRIVVIAVLCSWSVGWSVGPAGRPARPTDHEHSTAITSH
jgi:hypothetical protein